MNHGKIVASIEARMGSGRLPGKVLLPCLGKPMLARLIERVKHSKFINEVVVATTIDPADDAVEKCALEAGARCYRGSANDVSGRVLEAMKMAEADVVVQLTGDNPLVDPQILDQLLRIFLYNRDRLDFVVNTGMVSFPEGTEAQVLSLEMLAKSYAIGTNEGHHEHVCLAIHENPDQFRIFNLVAQGILCRPDIRLTMDEKNDYELILRVFESFLPSRTDFSMIDIVNILEQNPAWLQINEAVHNKPLRPES